MDTDAILKETDHRPWPLPRKPWGLQMSWRDLAFLHWPVSPEQVRPLLPAGLTLDTFDRSAWIAVTPFRMADVRVRMAPPIPTTSNFPELNVRTYVRAGDRPGIWFLSLDAGSRLAVRSARFALNLPYFDAEMKVQRTGERLAYRSRRTHRGAPPATFRGSYGPTGPAAPPVAGSLEHWLTERYCLFTVGAGKRIFELDIHHRPWPLQPAAAAIETNSMVEAGGIRLPVIPPLVHYAGSLDVLAWPPFALTG